MDQCRQCSLRGDRVGCEQADCSWHELWYVGELREEIKRLKDQVNRQKVAGSWKNSYPDDGFRARKYVMGGER